MRGGRREAQRAHDERDGGRVPGPRQCLEEDRLSTEHVKPLRGSVTEEEGESGTKITLDNAALSDMAKDRKEEHGVSARRRREWASRVVRSWNGTVVATNDRRCGS